MTSGYFFPTTESSAPQNSELRETYDRDIVATKKTVSNLEARLAAEKGASTVLESRLANLTVEAREARDRLINLESTASTLELEVRHCCSHQSNPNHLAETPNVLLTSSPLCRTH